jgi:hypothetical protein
MVSSEFLFNILAIITRLIKRQLERFSPDTASGSGRLELSTCFLIRPFLGERLTISSSAGNIFSACTGKPGTVDMMAQPIYSGRVIELLGKLVNQKADVASGLLFSFFIIFAIDIAVNFIGNFQGYLGDQMRLSLKRCLAIIIFIS